MNKLLLIYIGKSNKKFTNDVIYNYYLSTDMIFVTTNKHTVQHFNTESQNFFNKNFKFITDQEHKQFHRLKKLKKINKCPNNL
jgi:hypothetical protein